jgi:hypothetical protein
MLAFADNNNRPSALTCSAPLLIKAPTLLTPAPASEITSVLVLEPLMSKVAPSATEVPFATLPSAVALPNRKVPCKTLVSPAKLLAPLSTRVPAPDFDKPADPEMMEEIDAVTPVDVARVGVVPSSVKTPPATV